MNKKAFYVPVLTITFIAIIVPVLLMVLWSFVQRWPWPLLLPEDYSMRTIRELLFGSANAFHLIVSSVSLSMTVALLGTVIGTLTARASEFYTFRGKSLIRFASLLPLIVPGTVLAMGLQIVFIRLHLTDTVAGVILIHLVSSLPYCITIMTDATRALGPQLEEQAIILGANSFKAFWLASFPNMIPAFLASLNMGFIISYSQYFTTLIIGGGRVKTIAMVLFPYIQSGDRPLMSAYSSFFIFSGLFVFMILELLIKKLSKETISNETEC
ncbi:MAG: ABC transporter permease subunit [Firmicutes bacterium]|nr:ABC transporter permease subunit [Bacillota bacterium]